MIFNFKYLILPLSIMACINNNCINAMEDKKPNKIIENNIGDDSKNNNHNKSKINNQQNNEFLQIRIDNENDKEKIKELVTHPIKQARIILGELCLWSLDEFVSRNDYEISNLLKSFNNWNLNKLFTVDQLKTMYDIVKGAYFLLNYKEEMCRGIGFVIDDRIFGVGFKKLDNCDCYGKCIFIQPNRYGLFIVRDYHDYYEPYYSDERKKKQALTNMSFKNFLDAVKLCSTKKLPIQFTNDNKDKYFINSDEYRDLLLVLLRDFWIAFHGEYKYELLLIEHYHGYYTIEIKSVEEYEKIKQKDYKTYAEEDALYCYGKNIMLQKIEKAFEDEYDEKNFIEIFGEETINNIRYIIHHLIDIEINNNHELFEDTLDEILSKENNLYGTMRKSETKGKALIDKLVKELKNDKKLEQQFGQICKKVWTDNIVLPEDKHIFKQLGEEKDQYKLSSKQRVENYLKKLFYDKTLDNYLRNNLFKYIIGSNALITDIHKNPSGTPEDRDLVKEKHIENIKSSYILRNILEYIKDSNRLKKGLFFNKKEDKNDKISNKINSNNNKCSDKFDTNNNKINNISDDNNSNKFD